MCPPKVSVPEPETVNYAPPAPEPEEAPVLKDPGGKDREASSPSTAMCLRSRRAPEASRS